jgi:NodT family efflux transporter outer membrane factor (OMF) lipoprotein
MGRKAYRRFAVRLGIKSRIYIFMVVFGEAEMGYEAIGAGRGGVARVLALCLAASFLAGCAIKRDAYETPEVPLPQTFLRDPAAVVVDAQTAAAQGAYLKKMLPEWWRAFGSDELESLVERALKGNGDLRMAALRVVQSHALMGQEEAALYPELSASVSAGAEAPKDGTGTVGQDQHPPSERTYEAGLDLTWSPDLWGEYTAASESAAEDLRAAIFARDNIRSTVVSQTVQAYLRYLSLSDRMRTARKVTGIMVEMLDSLNLKLRDRDATALRVAQQKSVTYASIAAIPDLEMQREQAHDQLAFLIGTVPEALTLKGDSLTALRLPPVPQGLPPQFVLRRPDVREAEAQLLAADADIDVARARVLPPLDLRAGYGYGSVYLRDLFTPENVAWNLLATLTATIFDGGKRSLAVTQNKARHLELVEGYVRTIYQAVREVEDALSAQTHLARRLAAQETSVEASDIAYRLSRESHDYGTVDYLTVLDSERTWLRSLDDLHQIRLARYTGMVDYFTALGGGARLIGPDQEQADEAGGAATDSMEDGADAAVVGTTVEDTVAAAEAKAKARQAAGSPAPEAAPAPPAAVAPPAVVAPIDDMELRPLPGDAPDRPVREGAALKTGGEKAPDGRRWVLHDGVWRASPDG